MNGIRENQLRALARLEAFPSLSVFFPVAGGGAPGRPDLVRLRNALRAARDELAAAGVGAAESEALLAPAAALAESDEFWTAPPGGVALYLAPGFFRPVRVEEGVPELVQLGRRFALRPLLPELDRPGEIYVLALSRKRVRLLAAGAAETRELALPDLPESFAAALGELQFHSGVQAHTGSGSALGRRAAIFHGHGDDDEEHFDADLASYCRRIAEVLESKLPQREAPVVLAAVGEYAPMFRQAARRLHLLAETLPGNPDLATDAELAASARRLAAREIELRIAGELARWAELRAGGRAADDLAAVLAAAEEGRVETLFLAREAERWGSYEPDLRRVVVHERREAGDEELLDRAAARTLTRGGDVHVVAHAAMPENRVAVASLRYASPE
jgi:hypothetical protein